MAHVHSTYEAKAKFSEVIRKVRAGQRILIAYRVCVVFSILGQEAVKGITIEIPER